MPDPIALLHAMLRIRAFETALAALPDHGFQLLSTGEEAVAAGLASALTEDDQLLTGGRSIGPALARGVDPQRLMAELLGRATGTNRGKAGRGHLSDPDAGFFGAHAVVGGNLGIAAGVALARHMQGYPGITAILFGDGAAGAGGLHETLNIASLWHLPLLFLCNNNQLSVSTPRDQALAPKSLSGLAAAYGMKAATADGMDVAAVAAAAADAVRHVRRGAGPAFLECVSFRFSSHSTTARETRTPTELAAIRARCPIARQAAALIAAGLLAPADYEAMLQEAGAEAAAACRFAENSPYPARHEALADVW